jgi:hypothetical protein
MGRKALSHLRRERRRMCARAVKMATLVSQLRTRDRSCSSSM